jgi:hypothetical protein
MKKTIKKKNLSYYRHAGYKGERRYSPYSLFISALDGVSGQCHVTAALCPRVKDPSVPIGQEAGWASELVWTHRREEKCLSSAGNRTPIARLSSLKSDTVLTERCN